MTVHLNIKFIEKLSTDTKENKISWESLLALKDITEEKNYHLFYTLFENEWHSVNYSESFFASVDEGSIYLINESFESGKDGTITSGFNLYIQKNSSSQLIKINASRRVLYSLVNTINESVIESEKESFIKSYLGLDVQ